jgi:hypothetical protein
MGFSLAAEMAIGCGARIDRLVKIEMGADAARGQVHRVHQNLFELRRIDLAGAVQIGIDRQGLRHADGVRELNGAAVHLGGILALEGAATMRSRATIRVDDDLTAGEAGIAVGTADHEFTGRVDVPDGLSVCEALA